MIADFNPRSREGSDNKQAEEILESLVFQSTLPRGERLSSSSLRFILESYFNPRSREGSDSNRFSNFPSISIDFNPRSREGSDNHKGLKMSAATRISIHAPARGATFLPNRLKNFYRNFNPRSREGSDGLQAHGRFTTIRFQSTLPRGERRYAGDEKPQKVIISIHAPARGATGSAISSRTDVNDFNPRSREGSDTINGVSTLPPMQISIHAPARGATSDVRSVVSTTRNFNPRSREGSDVENAAADSKVVGISIHAPARGATMVSRPIGLLMLYFNPRSREGSDGQPEPPEPPHPIFQSTLPRGERLQNLLRVRKYNYFNPRSREGSDKIPFFRIRHILISIHAPARGATISSNSMKSFINYFNPRSREGSD